MAKSKHQYLKRMAKRHPLQIAVGNPFIYTESGFQLLSLKEKDKHDLQRSPNLYLGGTPDQMLENAFLSVISVGLSYIYIERIASIPNLKLKKIEYRILTRVGWEH